MLFPRALRRALPALDFPSRCGSPCIPNARPPQTSRLERRATLKHLQNRAHYCKITRGLEAYRSGHNEPHSKCGDGQPSASSNLAASAKAKRHPHTGAFFAFSEARCGTLRLTAILSKNGYFPRSNRTNRQMGAKFGGFFARRLRLFQTLGVSCTLPERPTGHRPPLMPHTSPLQCLIGIIRTGSA